MDKEKKTKQRKIVFRCACKGSRKRKVVKTMLRCEMITAALKTAEVAWSTHHGWLRNDPDYREDLQRAEEYRVQRADDSLYKRGVVGLDKQVGWYQGKAGGTERVYDTDAVKTWLRAHDPERYANVEQPSMTVQLSVEDKRTQLVNMIGKAPELLALLAEKTGGDVMAAIEGGGDPQSDEACGDEDPSPLSDAELELERERIKFANRQLGAVKRYANRMAKVESFKRGDPV